jgi:predicted MFS family arabinose efflux permease
MTSIARQKPQPQTLPETGPPAALIFLLACAAGLSVASLYYNQPILGLLATGLHASPTDIGRIPTLTQIGYAIGLLFLTPLGDKLDRRRVILVKIALLGLALLGMAAAHSLVQLCALSALIGIAASLAQDCVPAAAALAPEASRGKIVGKVMAGLLLGILLSRVFSGLISDALGWRAMFLIAAGAVGLLGLVAARRLPHFAPTTNLPYQALLASLGGLWQKHARLRQAAFAQGLLAAAFSAFWSTLAIMLREPPFGFGATIAGIFGLAGAVGALAAPLTGSLADRKGPDAVLRLSATLVVVSFAGFALFPHNLALLIIGTLVFDLGVQSSLIAHQSIIFSLEPAARGRINALFMTTMFVGMASGSALGSRALAHGGWREVSLFGATCALLALLTGWRPKLASSAAELQPSGSE